MFDKLLTDYADQLALFEEEYFVQSSELEGDILVTLNDFANDAPSGNATDDGVNLNESHFMTLDESSLSALNLGND